LKKNSFEEPKTMPATEVINLRISNEQKALIDHAARTSGKNRSAFILENALRCAEDILLDRSLFFLDDRQWEQFSALLDDTPSTGQAEKLQALLHAPAPWDKG
jgi:uncharacterized protein (DUF1778 family)